MNHLENEKSPYLRQHREQALDWYPWGEAAFSKAKEENKPILLSIGYSTCHWCHVMAQESFADEGITRLLNESFVAIKVDREERPDIDAIYMRVCQGMTGSGGWPLTILMTPEQAPFFAGTYLPQKAFYNLLLETKKMWKQEPDALWRTGRQLVNWLQQPATESEIVPPAALWEQAVNWFEAAYDRRWGGFGAAPKFPSAHTLSFLLRYAQKERTENSADIRKMVAQTLQKMAQGGIRDHLGGGFSRYSTDEKWLMPHFEKTLYDNALLAMAYSEAGYHALAQETLDYVLRELRDEEGGFYCGQDADSQGQEGLFYLWSKPEVIEALGQERGEAFWRAYHMERKGLPNQIGEDFERQAAEQMDEERRQLFAYRKTRYPLGVDDKILTAWNGLAIAAFAQVGRRQQRREYLQAAAAAAAFLEKHLVKTSGRLYLRYRDGEAAHVGQLSDYAYYAYGLLQLYKAVHKASYLLQAVHTAQHMQALFADPEGGYFTTAKDAEPLIARLKDTEDGALPSGNAVAAWVLIELAHFTGESKWRAAADKQISFMSRQAANVAAGHTFFLQALQLQKYQTQMLVCAAAADDFCMPEIEEAMQDELAVLVKTPAEERLLQEAAPFTKQYPIPEKGVSYYYCSSECCQAPVTSFEEVKSLYNAQKNGQTNSQN